MKHFLLILAAALMLFSAASPQTGQRLAPDAASEQEEESTMQMMIGPTPVTVAWENNESVDALCKLAQNGLTIQMSMYGSFEQVGAIGARLPRNDEETTTASGDVVLYSGNQLVVFYGSNSWAYTRLGRITDKSQDEMRDLLGSGDVTITLSMQSEKRQSNW